MPVTRNIFWIMETSRIRDLRSRRSDNGGWGWYLFPFIKRIKKFMGQKKEKNTEWHPYTDEWEYAIKEHMQAGNRIINHMFRNKTAVKKGSAVLLMRRFLDQPWFSLRVAALEKGHFHGQKPYARVIFTDKAHLISDNVKSYEQFGTMIRLIGTCAGIRSIVTINLYPTHIILYASFEGNKLYSCDIFRKLFEKQENRRLIQE